ncbi:MAG TPA: antitoxin Xre-like helix-turn-helix domain-containing protein [Nevskiaceae bacterium]|nr:antitoxin Xre-like helix-turn-helix domain-containing protein [Nevskiaceae bacterium]
MARHPTRSKSRHATAASPAESADWAGRRNAVGLREVLSIARKWELSLEQLCTLLRTPARTLQRWRRTGEETGRLDLPADTIERISYLLGISKALTILLPTPANRLLWLRNANAAAPFNGQAPLDRLLQGQVADLFVVRRHLDGARG